MSDSKRECAENTFRSLCKMLDNHDWKYGKDDDRLCIRCGANGEDLPIELIVDVDESRQLIILISELPFKIPEDKRMETAIAVNMVNYRLNDGFFDYDIVNGDMYYRMSSSFIDSEISEEVFEYLIFTLCATVDEYNDKFLMLSKGLMSLESFLADEQ